jgi:hypothetical protein
MRATSRIAIALLLTASAALASAAGTPAASLTEAESAFLEHLDAVGAVGYLESGGAERYAGRDLAGWQARQAWTRRRLDAALRALHGVDLPVREHEALTAIHKTLASLAPEDTSTPRAPACSDAGNHDLDYDALRAALANCFVEHGSRLRHGERVIDRGTALQLLHVVDDPAERKAIFESFGPLWTALNGRNEPDSPYRRVVRLAAVEAQRSGSEIDAAARAIGIDTPTVERWLVQVLEAWRDANPGDPVEPWDFRHVHGRGHRELETHVPATSLLPVNRRFYRDLGADLDALRVVFDLAPRPGKSPLAYSDFLERGRTVDGRWRRPRARVLGSYPEGGLFALNELVHEDGHAVHVSAIHARPAYMDWPDTLFVEAFADVPSWSVHEPAWQQKYLGAALDEATSMRALFANVMLDVAWSLFELRLLREPAADPNALWTDITQRYLNIVAHPEVPWWAMRVQLASDPGYMVNYGLGAVLTAEIRARTIAAIGPFDSGNPRWYPWLGERLLRYGSERPTQTLLQDLLGRPVSPEALLVQLRRTRDRR